MSTANVFHFIAFEMAKVFVFIKFNKIDILHVHTLKALLLTVFLKPFLYWFSVKIIYTGHGIRFDQFDCNKSKRIMYKNIERLLILVTHRVTYIRKYDYELGIGSFGYRKKSDLIVTRINRLYRQTPYNHNNKFEVVTIGSLIPLKAPQVYLELVEQVLAINPKIIFTWIGDGPLFEKCQTIVKRKGISSSVRFLGYMPHDDVQEYLNENASLYLCTSEIETFPMVFLESMSTSTPIISRKIKGLEREYYDSVLFSKDQEIPKLINDVYQLDAEAYLNLRAKSSQIFDRFFCGDAIMKSEYECIYKEMME